MADETRSSGIMGPMTRAVTIEDIAAAAGVSRQTVSRAINGMPRISEETRARVIEISERLGYRPSRFAANLARTQKVRTIGVVVDSFRNPFYSELTADLLDEAASRGWQVTVSSHENEPVFDLVARLAGEVDAIVGYFGRVDEGELVAASRGVPIVLLGSPATFEGLHSVDIDFDAGILEIVAGLRERGVRRFGMIESEHADESYSPSTRRRAYENAVDSESAGAVVVERATAQSVDAGERGLRDLLDAFPDTEAVIVFSDLMAMGALRAAQERGVAVPAELRIVGIDGLSLGAALRPALTSLAIIGRDFTGHIAELVDGVLSGRAAPPERRRAAPHVVWRESA